MAGDSEVTDEELVVAMEQAINLREPNVLAITARDVSSILPIKRQAVAKRLNRLAENPHTTIQRFHGGGSYVYYDESWDYTGLLNQGKLTG